MQNNTAMKAAGFYLVAGLLGLSMLSCQPAGNKTKSDSKEGISAASEWISPWIRSTDLP